MHRSALRLWAFLHSHQVLSQATQVTFTCVHRVSTATCTTRRTMAEHTAAAYGNKGAILPVWSIISDLTQDEYFDLLATVGDI